MLDLYIICWRNYNITVDCLESLLKTASEPLNITVVSPNDTLPNSGTDKIREYLKELVNEGRIKRALFFNENVRGHGLMKALMDFPPSNGEFFFLTDGDLVVPENVDWIKLTKDYHERGHVVTGFNLSTENYLPPNSGFSSAEENFGCWLLGVNTEVFNKHYPKHLNIIDGHFMTLGRGRGKNGQEGGMKIREAELLHATWSVHYKGHRYYDLEYSELKIKAASSWVFASKPDMSYELYDR